MVQKNKTGVFSSLVIWSAFFALVFEQSPLNEALRAWLGFTVLDYTNNPLFVAAVVFTVTLAIEQTSSSLIAIGLSKSKRFGRFVSKFSKRKSVPESSKNSASDYILALGIGAGMLVIKNHLKNSHRSIVQDLKSAFKASLAIAVFSSFVAFMASGGVEIARLYGFGTQAQFFLDVVTDWRFWLVVVVSSQFFEFIKNKTK